MAATNAATAYEVLTSELVGGKFAPGTRLREAELAASLGMSRTPVREALRRLTAEGLAEVTANSGVVVSSFSAEELDEVFKVRVPLEAYAARRCAERATPALLEQLSAICDQMDLARESSQQSPYELAQLNTEFHSAIYKAAESRPIRSVLSKLLLVPLVHYTFTHYSATDMRRSIRHHREMIEAFDAADADWAEAIMQLHVRVGRSIVRRGLEAGT